MIENVRPAEHVGQCKGRICRNFRATITMESDVLGLINNTHPSAAQLLDDAVVRDGLTDHWRESYVDEMGKSMKAESMASELIRLVGKPYEVVLESLSDEIGDAASEDSQEGVKE